MTQTPTHAHAPASESAERPKGPPRPEIPDLSEKGAARGGQPQTSNERLFMQLLAFTGCEHSSALGEALAVANIEGVVYENVSDPRGVAVLTFNKDPNFFLDTLRPQLLRAPFDKLTPLPQYTMFGRTYSLGYEPSLQDTLFDRPRRTALNPAWPWAVWYPLRRSGQFERLTKDEQMAILREHGTIGMAFGAGDFAHDIRLDCHGLDTNDNDFVVALIGKELFPLSAVVQSMRKTQQTSLYLTNLGPFWVGRAVWQSKM